MEYLIASFFVVIVLFIVFVLRMQKRKMMKSKIDHSTKFDFQDQYGNFYNIVRLGGTKILLRWPDEIEKWNGMKFDERKAMIDESEYKAKRGKLSKVLISGAIGYQPIDTTIKHATTLLNARNQK